MSGLASARNCTPNPHSAVLCAWKTGAERTDGPLQGSTHQNEPARASSGSGLLCLTELLLSLVRVRHPNEAYLWDLASKGVRSIRNAEDLQDVGLASPSRKLHLRCLVSPHHCSSGCIGAQRDEERSRLRNRLLNRSVPRCRHMEED